MNLRRRPRRARDFPQEGAFALIAFDEVDRSAGLSGEPDRQNHAGKPGAGAEIDPSFGARRKIEKLRAIGDMPRPDFRETRFGDQIGDFSPSREEIDVEGEALFCFT